MTPEHELRIVKALERIADALDPATQAEPVCGHQAETRTDMSTMGHPRWICDPVKGGCGFSVGTEG